MSRLFFRTSTLLAMAASALASPGVASAQSLAPEAAARTPFTSTLSNNVPLQVGMDVADTAQALGSPLSYVSGRAGDEVYLAFRDVGGSGLFPQHHRLYLQFRSGRLSGWKGDWGHNWMWQ